MQSKIFISVLILTYSIRFHLYLFILLSFRLTLKLIKPMVFNKGQRFTIRDGKVTVGTGVVTDIKKSLTEDERIEILGGKKARDKKAKEEAAKAAKTASKKGK